MPMSGTGLYILLSFLLPLSTAVAMDSVTSVTRADAAPGIHSHSPSRFKNFAISQRNLILSSVLKDNESEICDLL